MSDLYGCPSLILKLTVKMPTLALKTYSRMNSSFSFGAIFIGRFFIHNIRFEFTSTNPLSSLRNRLLGFRGSAEAGIRT